MRPPGWHPCSGALVWSYAGSPEVRLGSVSRDTLNRFIVHMIFIVMTLSLKAGTTVGTAWETDTGWGWLGVIGRPSRVMVTSLHCSWLWWYLGLICSCATILMMTRLARGCLLDSLGSTLQTSCYLSNSEIVFNSEVVHLGRWYF